MPSAWSGVLQVAAAVVCLGAIFVAPPIEPVRPVAGLLLLLILPGLALRDWLLPRASAENGVVGLFLAVGLSMAVTAIWALVFAIFPAPGSFPAVPAAVAITTIVAALLAARGGRPPPGQRFLPIAWGLGLLMASVIAVFLGRSADPLDVAPFTAFSLVGPDGTAESLLTDHCQEADFTLIINSYEREARAYEVWEVSGARSRLVTRVGLVPGQTVRVTAEAELPTVPMASNRFELRVAGEAEAYRWLDACAG